MLAGVHLLVACVSTPAPSPTAAVVSSSPSASPCSSDATPPPHNRLETKVIEALARLGISGQRAELPFENAAIWARLTTGDLFVSASRTGTAGADATLVDERQIEGVRVQRVQYGGPPLRYRFACGDDTYELRGATPSGSVDMETFVGRFIRALDCQR